METEWQRLVRYALQHASRASPGRILVRHTPQYINGSAATGQNCILISRIQNVQHVMYECDTSDNVG